MISPYTQLPTSNNREQHATVLIVGPPASGKRTLSRQLIEGIKDASFNCRTAESLPLPSDDKRPRYDFVIFLLDLTNRQSFDQFQRSLPCLSPEFLMGRSCIVLTRADKITHYSFDSKDVKTYVEQFYDIPIFHTNLSNEEERATLSEQLFRCIQVSSGYQPFITPARVHSMMMGDTFLEQ
ncbi:uncharacterized protein VTP21DRAFT_10903 [Calcarisporiella thermophila]|uniref:uncharacterized protein n=1 Tax=Calcarisporiella thermophila TaxID=911321 RepID=UPI003741ED36